MSFVDELYAEAEGGSGGPGQHLERRWHEDCQFAEYGMVSRDMINCMVRVYFYQGGGRVLRGMGKLAIQFTYPPNHTKYSLKEVLDQLVYVPGDCYLVKIEPDDRYSKQLERKLFDVFPAICARELPFMPFPAELHGVGTKLTCPVWLSDPFCKLLQNEHPTRPVVFAAITTDTCAPPPMPGSWRWWQAALWSPVVASYEGTRGLLDYLVEGESREAARAHGDDSPEHED